MTARGPILLALWLAPAAASALPPLPLDDDAETHDLVPHLEGLLDPAGALSLSDLDDRTLRPIAELESGPGTWPGERPPVVWLRFAVRVNGITSLALTKLDVLSDFDKIPVCVRYRLPDGSETEDFPAHQSDFHHCEPVFEPLAGWRQELSGPELPAAAASYVRFVSDALDVPVTLVGTGASRDAVLAL